MKHLLRNMIGIFAVTLFVLLFYACEQDPQITNMNIRCRKYPECHRISDMFLHK